MAYDRIAHDRRRMDKQIRRLNLASAMIRNADTEIAKLDAKSTLSPEDMELLRIVRRAVSRDAI